MKEIFTLRWIAVLCMLTVCLSAFASDRAEPNAFLNRKADSVTQLIKAVQNDPEVADRYARHFGKSKDELVSFFNTLHLAKLNESGTYNIYLVDEQGVIKAKPQHLKAGTRVFADASGMPVLKASCGNAMVTGSNLLTATLVPGVGGPVSTLHELPVRPTIAEATLPQTAMLSPTTPVALEPIMPEPGQVTKGNSNQGFVVPAVFAGLGGAAAILVSGGHGNTPVPEPATILVISGALVALRARRKSK